MLRDSKPFLPTSQDQEEIEDIETEDIILSRALEEVALENVQPLSSTSSYTQHGTSNQLFNPMTANDNETSDRTFPKLPTVTKLPMTEENDEDEKNAEVMMSRLLGLTRPSQAPGLKLPSPPKREVGKGLNLPGYDDSRDDDIDSWCCK